MSTTGHPRRVRTVLVTGAAKRLGRAMALRLAEAGWNVAVHYGHSHGEALDTAAACRALGSHSQVFDADLSDQAACRALVPRVVAAMGGLDAVINNASLFEHDSATDFGFERMEQHLRCNTGAAILLAQGLHRHCIERQPASNERGVVVNLLDQKLWNLNPDFFSYTLSKAALHAATQMLALALAPAVRVVGVAPGLTLTSHMLSAEKFAELHRQSPLGQSSTPADVADAVHFVLHNPALTGSTLLVDGGQHLMRFERDFSLM